MMQQGYGRPQYDGRRMRMPVTRRTVDHAASMAMYMQDRRTAEQPLARDPYAALAPKPDFLSNYLPPMAYGRDPMNALTTKFVHMSMNKVRCPINVARCTPDAKRILTGASTGEFTLWNGITFNFETIMQAHDSAIRAMTWSHNGNFLITGDHAGILKYWQPSMNNLKIIQGHKEPVRSVSFSPNDSKFASCSDDGSIKIWDFSTATEERQLSGHCWDVKNIDWHPTKCLLASGSKDHLVKLWDPASGTNLATMYSCTFLLIILIFNLVMATRT
jgi:polyadenylation factor subunit 2